MKRVGRELNMRRHLKNPFVVSMVLLLVLVVPIVVAMLSSWQMSEETLGYRNRILPLVALASTIFSNSSSMLSVDRFVYEVGVLVFNNMSVSVDRDGFLTIFLVNRGGEKLYEDFTWIVQGYTPRDFPKRFRGVVEPRSRAMVYRAYLPTILNRTGEYEVIIMSSEVLVFNVSMSSPEEVLRVKELVSRITPILRVECAEPRPKVCKVSLPKYSLYLKVRVGLNPEKLRHLQVIEKPKFIDVVFSTEGNKTVIELFVVNRGNTSLRIVNYISWDVAVYDIYGKPLTGCSLRASILKSSEHVVEPGQRKFINLFKLCYKNGVLYVNGANCAELKPGKYILGIRLHTKPGISVKVIVALNTSIASASDPL